MYSKDEINCLERTTSILKTKVVELLAIVKDNPKNDTVYMDLQNINSIIVKLNTIVSVGNYELNKNKNIAGHIYLIPPKETNIALNYFIENKICIDFFEQVKESMRSTNAMLVSPIAIDEAVHAISCRLFELEEMYKFSVNAPEFKNGEYTYHDLKTSIMNLLELVQSFNYSNGAATNVGNNNE